MKKNSVPAALYPIFFLFILDLALSYVATKAILYRQNTLDHNGQWQATKAEQLYYLMGSFEFLETRTALAQNRLNLGSWHGHQEVTTLRPLDVSQVDFDFTIKGQGQLLFIFHKNHRQYRALRFSTDPHFPSALLKVTRQGQYLEKELLTAQVPIKKERNHVKAEFRENGFKIFLNDAILVEKKSNPMKNHYLGFRGGETDSYIDNVQYKLTSSKIIKEDFENTEGSFLVFSVIFFPVGLLALFLVRFFTFKYQDSDANPYYPALVLLTTLFLLVSVTYVSDYFHFSKLYPKPIGQEETPLLGKWGKEIDHELVKEPKDAENDQPDLDELEYIQNLRSIIVDSSPFQDSQKEYRIIFLGSSQTWGAGASSVEETWVYRTCLELQNKYQKNQHVRCLNAGISGATSRELLEFYKEDLLPLSPQLVVVNLSHNDNFDQSNFTAHLQEVVRLNGTHNIKTFFIVEPNSTASLIYSRTQQEMIQLAGKLNVPLLDPVPYFVNHADDGLIWWDSVHLTSFGQKIFGEFVSKALGPLFFGHGKQSKSF